MGRSASTTSIKSLDAAALAAAAAVLIWKLHPLLTRNPLAGWDLTPHYYLFERMVRYLSQGQLSGYNPYWSGGYPEFELYPPLFHAVIASVKLAFTFDSRLVFNTAIFLLPFLLAVALFAAAKLSFGPRAGVCGLLMALVSLTFPPELRNFGVGLAALLQMGLVTNYFSLSLVAIFLGLLASLEKPDRGTKRIIAAGAVFGAVLSSHFACGMFCFFALFCFLISAPQRQIVPALLITALGAVLSSWWWIGFLRHFSFASIYTSGLPPEFPDPLAILFPLSDSFFKPGCSVLLDFKPLSDFSLTVPASIAQSPFAGLVVLFGCIAGTISLWRQSRLFLPAVLILSLLLLPRGFWAEFSPLPFHFARFIQPIEVAALLISAEGLRRFAAGPSVLRAAGAVLLAAALSLVFTSGLGPLSESTAACASPVQKRLPASVFQERYPSYAAAASAVKKICAEKPQGRIAVENGRELAAELGSPHFFTTFLPLTCDAEVVPGFLAESSKTDFYAAAVIGAMGSALILSDDLSRYSNVLAEKSPVELLEMLTMFDVRYVLASSRKLVTTLHNHPASAELRFDEGRFSFFQLRGPAGRAEPFKYKPFFFVDEGGPAFDEFAKLQFLSPELRHRPVLYTGRSFEELSASDQSAFEGIVLSTRATTYSSRFPDKKVVLLRHLEDTSFGQELISAQRPLDKIGAVRAEMSQRGLRLQMSETTGVFVQMGSDPDWNFSSGTRSVFFASPNRLAVLGSGAAELTVR